MRSPFFNPLFRNIVPCIFSAISATVLPFVLMYTGVSSSVMVMWPIFLTEADIFGLESVFQGAIVILRSF